MTDPQNDVVVALEQLNEARAHLRRARNVIYDMECDEYRQYGNRRFAAALEERRKEAETAIISLDNLTMLFGIDVQSKEKNNGNA